MPVIVRFQSTGTVPGDGRPVPMVGQSMTIGRGDENDIVLPDPDKVVSKRHCAIEDRGGNVVVVDLSTNGTFLNYDKVALGKAPTPLHDGDILCIGGYELVIDIPVVTAPSAADLPPLEDLLAPPSSSSDSLAGGAGLGGMDDPGGDDFLDSLLGPAPSGPDSVARAALDDTGPGADGLLPPMDDLLPPAAPSGPAQAQHSPASEDAFRTPSPAADAIPDDWDDFLAPPDAASPDNPFITPKPASIPTPPPMGSTRRDPMPTPETAPAPDPASVLEVAAVPTPAPSLPAGPDAGTHAFLAAAGLEDAASPGTDLTPMMDRVGRVFRGMVEGLRDVLMHRTALKSEFRIETTMISSQGNNPLKFSISPEQAVEAMIRPARGYQDPEAAAREALDDIKAHEVAMVTGMEAALKGVLAKLNPAELEGKITGSGGIGGLLKGKKARYWEAYESLYGEISEQAESDFQDLFAREFARAYQDQLRQLKHQKSTNGG